MTKLHLEYLEFYISHTCNFDCPGCNRFNNYLFTGHQKWNEHEETHKQWAEKLDLSNYDILGGEPTLNPDIIEWIYGLKKLWPMAKAGLTTNASFKRRFNQEFYQALIDTNTMLKVGLHNLDRRDDVLNTILNFVKHPVTVLRHPALEDLPNFKENWTKAYSAIRDDSWPECNTLDDWHKLPEHIKQECAEIHNFSPEILADQRLGYSIKDSNGLEVTINLENFFHQGSLIPLMETNTFTLHDSDPDKAHTICHSKTCHHMMNGKISKCGQVVLFQEFSKQFKLDISEEDQKLMMSYQPLAVDADKDIAKDFIDNIGNAIPQCKFCPDNYVHTEINSSISKNKFGKRIIMTEKKPSFLDAIKKAQELKTKITPENAANIQQAKTKPKSQVTTNKPTTRTTGRGR